MLFNTLKIIELFCGEIMQKTANRPKKWEDYTKIYPGG